MHNLLNFWNTFIFENKKNMIELNTGQSTLNENLHVYEIHLHNNKIIESKLSKINTDKKNEEERKKK